MYYLEQDLWNLKIPKQLILSFLEKAVRQLRC